MTDKAKKALEKYKKDYELLKSGKITEPATAEDIKKVNFVECAKESPKKPIVVIKDGTYNSMDLQDKKDQIIKIKAEEYEKEKEQIEPEESKERNL